MPYKYFNIELHKVEQLFDLSFPINVFLSFVRELGNRISGSNFNKYYQPPGSPHPILSMRFDVKEPIDHIMLDLSKKLKEEGIIRNFDNQLHDWNEPDFVVKAHEIGTACAIEFKNNIETNEELLRIFQNKPIEFTIYFAYIMLRSIGFNVNIIWSLLRESPVREDQIITTAQSCVKTFHDKIGEINVSPDFTERFIHAFFNCTISKAEEGLKGWLNESQFWERIVHSYRAS